MAATEMVAVAVAATEMVAVAVAEMVAVAATEMVAVAVARVVGVGVDWRQPEFVSGPMLQRDWRPVPETRMVGPDCWH